MADFNHVAIMGRLTRDPEVRYTGSGIAVTSISVAVNRRVKSGDTWTDEASFFDCTAFGKTAEFVAEYFNKGNPILIEGELQQRRWEKDGEKKSKVEIVVNKAHFVGGKEEKQSSATKPQAVNNDNQPPVDDDAIPF